MPDTRPTQEPRVPSVDEVIERNDKQTVQQLQQGYKQAQGLIDRDIANGRQAILNQYEIRRNDMKRKYDAETDPKRKQAILDQTMSAKSQAMAKIQALMDKHAPEKQELDAQMQAEVQKFQQSVQTRNTRLQAIRDAAAAGIITDPAVVQQAEFNAAYGVTIPLDKFKQPKGPSPEAKKAQLVRDIRNLDNSLKRFTPGDPGKGVFNLASKAKYVDPVTGEERKLNPNDPGDAAIIGQMNNLVKAREDLRKQYQNIILMENPSFRAAIEKTQRFDDAKKIYSGKNNTTKGGSIEASIRKQAGEQNKGKMVQMRHPDGRVGGIPQKNVAAALAHGFKRVQ
jgi:hypothetical protein